MLFSAADTENAVYPALGCWPCSEESHLTDVTTLRRCDYKLKPRFGKEKIVACNILRQIATFS